MYLHIRSSLGAVVALVTLLAFAFPTPARAGTGGAFISGTVVEAGKPVAGAVVTASGNNFTERTKTDALGRFTFPAVPLGSYVVTATSAAGTATARVDLGGEGATLVLEPQIKEIGNVRVVRAPPIRGSGADQTLNAEFLQRSPSNGSFPEALIQLPGAVRGANGVVHLNGDHGVINYIVDGVPIPQALNRQIGSEINPNDISFVDVIEGAFPAQYGTRFGSVLNISTRSGTGPAGFSGDLHGGSYTDMDSALAYHAPFGNGGGIQVAVRNERSTHGLDPPNFGSPHNRFADANQLLRVVAPRGSHDFTDLTVSHSFRSYQIPNDVNGGQPASTDDSEKQEDTFLNLQFRQHLGETGSLSFGPSIKISRIRDFGDPANDFTNGQALNSANGGGALDCANAISSPSSIVNPNGYASSSCAFSLGDDKTSTDYRFQSDYVQRFGKHEVRAGGAYTYTDVGKRYAITLQPQNFLAPILTPNTPNVATTVVDANSNSANTSESYVQDSWRIDENYQIDYGLRYDYFTIASKGFAQGFGAFSPRLKLTRFFGKRASVYAYAGRLFEPFSFENVDPQVAQQLNLPLQPTLAQFDLKPERDTLLELGGHLPLGRGSLGLRVWQKNANDLIDDTQVGVTLLHQDINYQLGRLSQESAFYEQPLVRNGRAYLSVAHTLSLNKGCETQLLAPCFGSSTVYTPADHDQSYSVTAGFLANDRHDGWFAFNGEYGSGLSSAICPPGSKGFCKRTPHTIFALEKGFGLGPDLALTLRVRNLLNDHFLVTILNAQGTHYAAPREVDVGIRFGR